MLVNNQAVEIILFVSLLLTQIHYSARYVQSLAGTFFSQNRSRTRILMVESLFWEQYSYLAYRAIENGRAI